MADTISIDKAGRLVLPKKFRERFNLAEGSKLSVESIGDHLELTPVVKEPEVSLERKNGLLVIPASGEDFDSVKAIQQDRDDRDDIR